MAILLPEGCLRQKNRKENTPKGMPMAKAAQRKNAKTKRKNHFLIYIRSKLKQF